MKVLKRILFCLLLPAAIVPAALGKTVAPFELFDGDRVVFIGDTLIEREQAHGYVEAALTLRFPDRHVTFRNLGWSADTPEGQSRVSFDWNKPREEWFQRLMSQVAQTEPTVVFLGYGMANSFDGEAALPKFIGDLNRLIDAIQTLDDQTNVRFVILSPIRHEKLPPPLPDPFAHNQQLAACTEALRQLAGERGFAFVNLFDTLKGSSRRPITDNGIHLTAYGYQKAAEAIQRGLGWKPVNIERLARTESFEHLRQAILRKNELFFHRWRPQNHTYLFGFRKHEQGQNAGEIPRFDPLVEEAEARIAELRQLPRAQARSDVAVVAPQPRPVMPQPLPHFEVAPGLEITLWAENPLLAKPIHMNFDPQGRLWVASSSVYPQIEPGQLADDKVIILEDTTGDGKADRAEVFVDGLLIPTGVEPGDGGVYVGQSTELLHFKDTRRDGKADTKRIVLSGFGTEDTHHTLHTLRWGPDGQLYMNQSIYIHSHLETPHGVVRLNSGGILNLRPSTMEAGIHMRGLINGWGHHFDRFGQAFATDGAGSAGIIHVVPGGMYITYAGARRILPGISPGSYPKFCGLEIVESEHFPEDWQGNAITCDFRAHRIVRFAMSERDSTFTTREMPDIVRSTNVTFRPIDVKLGPDGALYIADWSNPIIQHGEVDFRDPRRDQVHGRIWRVSVKDRAPLQPPEFLKSRNAALLDQLLSPNNYNRQQARRVLAERGTAVLSDLRKWTATQTSEQARLEALWMHQSLDVIEAGLLNELLAARDGRIRAAAVRVLSFWQNRIENSLDMLAERINDEHPRVRLEAVRALAKIPEARSAELVLNALEQPMDDFLDYAVWHSINDLAEVWVEAVKRGQWKPEGRDRQLEFALLAIESNLASEVLTRILRDRPLDREGSGPWMTLIARAGTTRELDLLYSQVLQDGFNEGALVRALQAMNEASRLRKTAPGVDLEKVARLFDHPSERVRVEAVRLAGTWKHLKENFPKLVAIASAPDSPDSLRRAAITSLREIGGSGAVDALASLSTKEQPGKVREPAVLALAALNMGKAVPPVIALLQEVQTEDEALEIWRSLLANRGAAETLARAIGGTNLPASSAKAGLRAAREGGRNEPELVLALTRAGNLEDEQQLSPAEMERLAGQVMKLGDAARGEMVYRRPELGCVSCHAIGGIGGKVGPDMTSIGASAPLDYLIESIFYPNAKIKEGYHPIVIETHDDQEISGTLLRETDQEVIVLDIANRELAVPKQNIKERFTGTVSLMPSGLVDVLTSQEQIDLFRFLAELGKPGPFDASRGNVARLWKLAPAGHQHRQDNEEKISAELFNTLEWQDAFTLVDGRLPREEMAPLLEVPSHFSLIGLYAAARFQLANAGKVSLNISNAPGALAWVSGKAVEANSRIETELSAGTHVLLLRLDHRNLPEDLRVESPDVRFLAE